MNIKLVAVDMDGTLLNSKKEMPEEFIPDCSLICQIEFQEILDRQVERVLKGEVSINDVR